MRNEVVNFSGSMSTVAENAETPPSEGESEKITVCKGILADRLYDEISFFG